MLKKILITGVCGFIGFHCARRLKQQKETVIGIDHFNSYYDVSLKRKRESILKQEKIEVYPLDVRDQKELLDLLEKNKITHVLHLAAQSGVRHSLIDPKSYIKNNLDGFHSILELVCKLKIPLVYASSSSVYGANTKFPYRESDPTETPLSLYAATKKSNELLAHAYHHLYSTPLIGLRFFTVYGPWGRPDMAYFLFAKKMLAKEPIELFNEGKMERDFTYIDDIVEGVVRAIDSCESKTLPSYRIYNLGNHHVESLEKLVTVLEQLLNVKAIKKQMEMQSGDVLKTFADITSAQKELGYVPKTSLEEGLKQFVKWFQNDS